MSIGARGARARSRLGCRLLILCLAGSALAPAASAAAPVEERAVAVTITTMRAWDGKASVYLFGPGAVGTPTYGQTLRAPRIASKLQEFRFVVKLSPRARFRAYVYEWDEARRKATGPARWSSLVTHTTTPDWELMSFEPSGLALAPGRTYVLFLSSLGLEQSGDYVGRLAQPSKSDLYADGSFVFSNQQGRVGNLTAETWDGGHGEWLGPGGDLAFRVRLTD